MTFSVACTGAILVGWSISEAAAQQSLWFTKNGTKKRESIPRVAVVCKDKDNYGKETVALITSHSCYTCSERNTCGPMK